ncbi:Uncharacterised protein [Klebsiella pneumoniae]|nr:Uncharacterised protein [Klebsiella pneumoniae]SLZ61358.1 Uncharacterised protein [Klebsiella pneumoniae]
MRLLANAKADIAGNAFALAGLHHKPLVSLVEINTLNGMIEMQIVHPFGGPAQVVGKLIAGYGTQFGGQEAVEFFALHQIINKAVRACGSHSANQIFQEHGLHMAVRHQHAGMPGKMRAAVKEAAA